MTGVAALYVERDGVYWDLPGVDPWDEDRDARAYAGPHPVVAHPPCQRWGRMCDGRPSGAEHPADSKAWKVFGLKAPSRKGGWVYSEFGALWTCYVEQGNYGHMSRKPTWLLAHSSCALPELICGPAPQRLHPIALERYGYAKARRIGMAAMVGGKDKTRIRERTPVAFRDLMLSIARSCVLELTNVA